MPWWGWLIAFCVVCLGCLVLAIVLVGVRAVSKTGAARWLPSMHRRPGGSP